MLAAAPKAGTAAGDVAALLQRTFGAVSSEDAKIRDRIAGLEEAIRELRRERRQPAQREVSTQTTEGDTPAFDALVERVQFLELLVHTGQSAVPEARSDVLQSIEVTEEANLNGNAYASQTTASADAPPLASSSSRPESASASPRLDGTEVRPSAPPPPPTNSPRRPDAPTPVLRMSLPKLPPAQKARGEASQAVAAHLSAVAPAPLLKGMAEMARPTGLDEAPMLARLERVEAMVEQTSAWQAWMRRPLHSELNGIRSALDVLAKRVDQKDATKVDDVRLQEWIGALSAHMDSALSSLDEAHELLDHRLTQLHVKADGLGQMLPQKADREELLAMSAEINRLASSNARITTPPVKAVSAPPPPPPPMPPAMPPSWLAEERAEQESLRELLHTKADRSDLVRLESALLAFTKPKSGSSGMVPLHERLSLLTPMMGVIADARAAGMSVVEPPASKPAKVKQETPVSPRRPASASASTGTLARGKPVVEGARGLGRSASAAWMPSVKGEAIPREENFFLPSPRVRAEPLAVGSDGALYVSR